MVDDPRWARLQRAVLAAGLATAVVAGGLQIGVAEGAGAWIGVVGVAIATLAGAALPVRPRPAATLRWDGAQWWWQRSGEPLAVTPVVVIDLEQWMLLRLDVSSGSPETRGGRPAVRWIAPTRRALGPRWASLRLHLFLAAA